MSFWSVTSIVIRVLVIPLSVEFTSIIDASRPLVIASTPSFTTETFEMISSFFELSFLKSSSFVSRSWIKFFCWFISCAKLSICSLRILNIILKSAFLVKSSWLLLRFSQASLSSENFSAIKRWRLSSDISSSFKLPLIRSVVIPSFAMSSSFVLISARALLYISLFIAFSDFIVFKISSISVCVMYDFP